MVAAQRNVRLEWKGKAVSAKLSRAAATALNEIGSECVNYAKQNHAGWKNITGQAERSIVVITSANPGTKIPYMAWGSQGTIYMGRLEFEHGSALRTSARINYGDVPERIRQKMETGA